MRDDVVALYVDPRGPYPQLLAPGHWYDEKRDARTYAGPWPVAPPGIKVCSAQQRRRTPIAFAEWLLELASKAAK